jgi:tRNA 2-thiouridine synthesizing protein C
VTKDLNSTAAKHKRCDLLFLSRAAPYGQNRANLCLDMALAAAVFEQKVNYVFLDDGVYQVLRGQDGSAIDYKTLGNALETLSLYGIENVYADQDSVTERGINQDALLAGVRLLDKQSITAMLADADAVFNL